MKNLLLVKGDGKIVKGRETTGMREIDVTNIGTEHHVGRDQKFLVYKG